jgi:DNA-binding CsgD family transcriptional regulator/PAS domain-containing protein
MNKREVEDIASPGRPGGARPGPKILVSHERLSDLIGSIYDCILTPANWEPTLDRINEAFHFANSVLGIAPLRGGGQVVNVGAGDIDQEWLAAVAAGKYTVEAVALWGGAERAQRFPLDEPILGSQSPGYADRHTNRYFTEILEPRGMLDAVLITIARDPVLLGYAAFSRHHSGGDIGETEVNGLRLLGPHFRRAVTISNLFDLKTIEARTFESALDAVAFGVVLVDESMSIVHANAVAEAMLAAGDPLLSESGTLALRSKAADDALQAAVRQAARDEAALGQRGIGIPASQTQGDPRVIHVMPLRRGEIRPGLVQNAVAALFVAPASLPPRIPTDALALIYNLTPAESRVLELVSEGVTQEGISDTLGIARSTAKTHLLHVFEKTGCSRQIDLVKLVARLSRPV